VELVEARSESRRMNLSRCARFTYRAGIGKLRPMTTIRAISALIATALLVWHSSAMAFGSPGCDQRKALARATSPDGTWVASIYNNICSDGGFVITIDDTVEITRPNEDASPIPSTGTVFGMDDHPLDVQTPLAVMWTGQRNLEVTIPNDAWAGKQESAFADVIISYKYVPDDPVERACLKQWRSLPSEEMVRRSLSPTDNVEAFLANCHAKGAPK
jgi:hypothetical protein